MKKIKLFNGSGWGHQGGHLYVGAHSVRDAAILIAEARIKIGNSKEIVEDREVRQNISWINVYYSKNAWGISMKDITPERGVWWSKDRNEKPVRVI
jgi:hypothetical protein